MGGFLAGGRCTQRKEAKGKGLEKPGLPTQLPHCTFSSHGAGAFRVSMSISGGLCFFEYTSSLFIVNARYYPKISHRTRRIYDDDGNDVAIVLRIDLYIWRYEICLQIQ